MLKTFDELSEFQQKSVISKNYTEIIRELVEGELELAEDDQKMVDEAIEEANRMHTPWFAAEYICSNEELVAIAQDIAKCEAAQTYYYDRKFSFQLEPKDGEFK